MDQSVTKLRKRCFLLLFELIVQHFCPVVQEAVRLVEAGQSIAAAARKLGVVDQTLYNWVKAQRQGKLQGADSKAPVSAEQMEISRLRAELARVKMERDILGKATAYFARGSS
jgi:transposase